MRQYHSKFRNDDIFEQPLTYYAPKHGAPKKSIQVPECFRLYVCPASCARRLSLRSIANGEIRESAFLLMDEADIISGGYEEKIEETVGKIIKVKRLLGKNPPRAFAVYVSCVDDFLGTDEDALLLRLRTRYEDTFFTVCHIDPISDGKGTPRGMILYDRLYDFLQKKTGDDDSVNIIASYASVDPDSEFYAVLKALGIHRVNELFRMEHFSEYENMANSRLNIVSRIMGLLAAETMQKKFGTPYLFLPTSYDLDTIAGAYRSMAETLGKPLPEELLRKERQRAVEAIRHAQETVGETPIAVDTYASMMPFALARALSGYGFAVRVVFAAHAKQTDREDMDYLEQNHPEIKIVRGMDYQAITALSLPREMIAIGFDAAYFTKALHFVDICHDETFFGYGGVIKLMRLIEEAYHSTERWEETAARDNRQNGQKNRG